jgi:hypothetical protein
MHLREQGLRRILAVRARRALRNRPPPPRAAHLDARERAAASNGALGRGWWCVNRNKMTVGQDCTAVFTT